MNKRESSAHWAIQGDKSSNKGRCTGVTSKRLADDSIESIHNYPKRPIFTSWMLTTKWDNNMRQLFKKKARLKRQILYWYRLFFARDHYECSFGDWLLTTVCLLLYQMVISVTYYNTAVTKWRYNASKWDIFHSFSYCQPLNIKRQYLYDNSALSWNIFQDKEQHYRVQTIFLFTLWLA